MLEDLLQGFMAGIVYQGKDTNMRMKTRLFTALILAGCFTASAQPQSPDEPSVIVRGVRENAGQTGSQFTVDPITGQPVRVGENLKRFDLKFEGGTPRTFIDAINKQLDRRINVVIPQEFEKDMVPAMEVFDVTLPQLFSAVSSAGNKNKTIVTGIRRDSAGDPQLRLQSFQTYQRFDTNEPQPSENSIWYFSANIAPEVPEQLFEISSEVEILQLTQLLDEYTIEDVTTAIKTAWGMLDSESAGKLKPGDLQRQLREEILVSESGGELKFHAETGLLVAKGTKKQLEVMSMVMEQLERGARIKEEREMLERQSKQSN